MENGAEALGVVVAEQPDVLLTGDRLAMMTGWDLLAQARLYAPGTVLAVQASDEQQADSHAALADAVFLRHVPPAVVADVLLARTCS
jgi:CheY-like chemotaxis protein